ncbi:MAG: glycosyltransferase family 87 protein [Desulfobaccales bacterium]
MTESKRKRSINQLVTFIKKDCLDALNASKQDRIYFYCRFFFIFISLLCGYQYLLYGCYWIIAGLLTKPGLTDLMDKPLGSDFVGFYAASKLALNGDPAGIYSISKLHIIEKTVIGADIGSWAWNYPPTFLVIVFPLALFPYAFSIAIWIFPALFCYLWMVRRIAPHPLTPWLFIAFPPTVNNLFYGQNGFFSTLLLGGGLLLIDSRPFMGGLLFGLLSYKPQLAIMIPVAIIAGRNWRVFYGAAVSSISLFLISLILFGFSTWKAFLDNIPFATKLANTHKFWAKMPTIFATARNLGADLVVAEVIQMAITLIAIVIVAWIWWKRAPLTLRGSSLVLATFLATPYAFEYDLVLIALPFAWLGWEEFSRGRRQAQGLLAACWLATFFSIWWQVQLGLLCLLAMFGFVIYRSLSDFGCSEDTGHQGKKLPASIAVNLK